MTQLSLIFTSSLSPDEYGNFFATPHSPPAKTFCNMLDRPQIFLNRKRVAEFFNLGYTVYLKHPSSPAAHLINLTKYFENQQESK